MTDMHNIPPVPAHISDPDLIAEVMRLAASERKAIAALVSALAELDSRRLYLGQGCSSMFTYCTQVLRLSEHAAFNPYRGGAGRASFPGCLGAACRWPDPSQRGPPLGAAPDGSQS
jgi:hypothetical protein